MVGVERVYGYAGTGLAVCIHVQMKPGFASAMTGMNVGSNAKILTDQFQKSVWHMVKSHGSPPQSQLGFRRQVGHTRVQRWFGSHHKRWG